MKIGTGGMLKFLPHLMVLLKLYILIQSLIIQEAYYTKASSIIFLRSDGVRVLYAHVKDVNVSEGDSIKAGDVVARVGNNGYSRHPHIHIGAWKGNTPLQISFDLREMGKQLKELTDNRYYL